MKLEGRIAGKRKEEEAYRVYSGEPVSRFKVIRT
jgi:hypothetical protein